MHWFVLYWRREDFSGWLVARLQLTPGCNLAEAARFFEMCAGSGEPSMRLRMAATI
ncbi:hypothetical protein [uncultured Rhodoblastus sp.]|uniref:hypothetical protein n=1 Tax=uncultured Rhodoblastus sp. TaxID=543037 RepID=UPI0025E7E643|nr:hypothetical protein [uncultured Rhodoblastus sp.]